MATWTLTLSLPRFFWYFHHLVKIGRNSDDFCHKMQNVYQMKDNFHAYLLLKSIFEIASKKVKKSVFENPTLLRGMNMNTPLVT